MKSAIPKLLTLALISLAAACGGLEPTAGQSTQESLAISPGEPAAPAKPNCVAGKTYGTGSEACTCKEFGNGVTCGQHLCLNCDPTQTPTPPNNACHCDTNDIATPVPPAPVQPALVPKPCDLTWAGCRS
jgi:hypothetical protein